MAHICLKSHNGGSHCLHNSPKVNVKKQKRKVGMYLVRKMFNR